VVVTDGPLSVTSSPALLTVREPVKITLQPLGKTLPVGGGTVTLSVVATGSQPLFYQWYLNGGTVNGGTASTLARQFSWNYYVVVQNEGSSEQSSTVNVNANTAPSVVVQPGTSPIISGGSFTFVANVTGTPPFYLSMVPEER